jgi:hypothetical protein
LGNPVHKLTHPVVDAVDKCRPGDRHHPKIKSVRANSGARIASRQARSRVIHRVIAALNSVSHSLVDLYEKLAVFIPNAPSLFITTTG